MIGFLISFLIFICVVAVVIIGLRWLIAEAGLPAPLQLILQIIAFIVCLMAFLYWFPFPAGYHVFPLR